jgi:hypothetical protein
MKDTLVEELSVLQSESFEYGSALARRTEKFGRMGVWNESPIAMMNEEV